MRKGLAIAVSMAIVLAVAVAAASSAPAQKRYYELAVDTQFLSQTDYGSDPRSVWIGVYRYSANFEFRAIVVFENRQLRISPGDALVSANVYIEDGREKLDRQQRRVPVCAGWSGSKIGREVRTGKVPGQKSYVDAPKAGVAIGGSHLLVNPGVPIRWKFGCAVGDFLHHHNLQAGPNVRLPRPTYARFAAGRAGSLTCASFASHDATHAHRTNYNGLFAVRSRYAPIAEDRLTDRVRSLHKLRGTESSNSLYRGDLPANPKPCPPP